MEVKETDVLADTERGRDVSAQGFRYEHGESKGSKRETYTRRVSEHTAWRYGNDISSSYGRSPLSWRRLASLSSARSFSCASGCVARHSRTSVSALDVVSVAANIRVLERTGESDVRYAVTEARLYARELGDEFFVCQCVFFRCAHVGLHCGADSGKL